MSDDEILELHGPWFHHPDGRWVDYSELPKETKMQPTVLDNDKGEITVSLEGRELRGWSYSSDGERRQKMLQAREYIEGWCDGREPLREALKKLQGRVQPQYRSLVDRALGDRA